MPQSSPFCLCSSLISALYLFLSCQPVLGLLVTLYLSSTRAFCPLLGCWDWVLLKPTEQNRSKLLQHLWLCNASKAAVDFLNNTFKQYFKKRFPINLMLCAPMNFPQPFYDFAVLPLLQDSGFYLEIGVDCSHVKCRDVCGSHPAECWSCCVLEVSVLEWRPLEDARERRLRSVIRQHCHSANCFNWKVQYQRKNTLLLGHKRSQPPQIIFCPKRESSPVLCTDMKG